VRGGGGDHGRASSISEQSTTRSVSDMLASDGEEQGQGGKLRTDLPATLCAELDAFMHFRTQPLNQMRASVAVVDRTSRNDRDNVLRFLEWLVAEKRLPVPTLAIFHSKKVAALAQVYVQIHVARGRKYSSCAKYVGSFLICARYVLARRRAAAGASPDTTAVDQLSSLHGQCLQQARQQNLFATSTPPANYLDWAGVQEARCAAERAARDYRGHSAAKRLRLTRDAVLLNLLTHAPPDRVGVARLLQLCGTLKPTSYGGYQLDLSEPGSHKTSAVFGPTTSTVPPVVAGLLTKWIELTAVPPLGYVFNAGNAAAPYDDSAWTKVVKAAFKRHSGVAMCPKDLRSSFIGFLKSEEHGDATLKAAAAAMRHSSQTQVRTRNLRQLLALRSRRAFDSRMVRLLHRTIRIAMIVLLPLR
jgi:hypothetical protein